MEEKRRLPSWMVNKVSRPLDLDENDVVIKDKESDVTKSLKPKAKRVTRNKNNNDDKSILVKCETKRKRRGSVEKDAIECRDHEEEVFVVEKRKRGRVGRKVEDQSLRKKKRKEDVFEIGNECQAESPDEEDDVLTMKDLLSIAKEFVENDKSDMVQQKSTEGQRGSKSKSSYTSVVTQTSLIAPHDTRSHMHEETTSHHDSLEHTTTKETTSHHDSLENTTGKVTLDTLAESGMTGDPAQDMLELFLGPLLKKPLRKEDASSIKDNIIPRDIMTQKCDVISNKQVTMTKKKSSLRDAVAMLLD